MFDILSSLLQGINDHFGRFVSLFRTLLPYKSIVQDSVALDPVIAESVVNGIDKTCIPAKTKIYLFQYINNKGQWEILFLSEECKYLGRYLETTSHSESLTNLDKTAFYKYES